MVPIQESMGWGRSVLSLSLAIQNLLMGPIAPFWGAIIETFHRPAMTFLLAAGCYIGGLFLFASAPSVPQAAWVAGFGILTGAGLAGIGLSILLAEVGRLFPAQDPAALRKRSLVFGIVPSVGQAGQFALVPIARSLISSVGWTQSAMIIAYQTMIILPLIFFLRRKTPPSFETIVASKNKARPPKLEDLGSNNGAGDEVLTETELAAGEAAPEPRPKLVVVEEKPNDNATAAAAVVGPQYVPVPEPPTLSLAIKEAYTHAPMIFISIAYFTCGWHLGFISSSLVAYLQDRGVSPNIAAWCLSSIGIGSMIGTFLSGFLPGMFKSIKTKWLLASVYYSRAVFVTILLVIPTNDAALLVICTCLGFSWTSTVPPTTSLTASILGTRWLGTILGISFASHQLGGFCGTYLGAVEYDKTGSYIICWWITVGLAAIAGTFVVFAGDKSLRKKEVVGYGQDYVRLGGGDVGPEEIAVADSDKSKA